MVGSVLGEYKSMQTLEISKNSMQEDCISFKSSTPVRSADGSILITDSKSILDCWADHYRNLLNRPNDADPDVLSEVSNAPTLCELD